MNKEQYQVEPKIYRRYGNLFYSIYFVGIDCFYSTLHYKYCLYEKKENRLVFSDSLAVVNYGNKLRWACDLCAI